MKHGEHKKGMPKGMPMKKHMPGMPPKGMMNGGKKQGGKKRRK